MAGYDQKSTSKKRNEPVGPFIAEERPADEKLVPLPPEEKSSLRLPPTSDPRPPYIQAHSGMQPISAEKRDKSLADLKLSPREVNEHLQITDNYGAHAENFLQMVRRIFPHLEMTAEMRATLVRAIEMDPWAQEASGKYALREDVLRSHERGRNPSENPEIKFLIDVARAQNNYDQFLAVWYNNEANTVRQQLYTKLKELSPDFQVEFASAKDIQTAGERLSQKITEYQLNSQTPKSLRELVSAFRGQGGFLFDDDSKKVSLSIGTIDPENHLQDPDSTIKQMAEGMKALNAPGTLGQALVHEQIHNLTGYSHPNEGSMVFQTPDHASEIPTVLYDLLMMVDSYHEWKKGQDAGYHYKENPTGIVLKLPRGELAVDSAYARAKDEFKVLGPGGVDKFLNLLSTEAGGAYLNKLIWDEGCAPQLSQFHDEKVTR